MNTEPDLKTLLIRLIEAEIDFVLIGGFAATVHGGTLVTQDIDICASITEDQVFKLRNALKDVHPVHRMNPNARHNFLDYPPNLKGWNNIYLETDLGVLDIVSDARPAGTFEEIKKRSIEIFLFGHPCQVISIDDLITVKSDMTRPKDKQTVDELRRLKDRSSL